MSVVILIGGVSLLQTSKILCRCFIQFMVKLLIFSLDPVAEQVQCNSQILKSLASVIEKVMDGSR